MRDRESVKNALKAKYSYLGEFEQLDACIDTGLAQLWGDEDVAEVFAGTSDHAPSSLLDGNPAPPYSYLLFVTDKARLVQTFEFKVVITGRIFDRTEYRHSSDVNDASWAEPNKARCVKRNTGGWRGRDYFDVIFDGIFPVTVSSTSEENVGKIRDAVISAAAKLHEREERKKPSAAASAPQQGADAIREIRKMYEDGLIDKAEMMDLLRSALKTK